jgi:hypothetical protein
VLTVGVLGVRGPTPLGVFNIDAKPPGEKRPFAVGDCNQERTEKNITKATMSTTTVKG